MCENSIKTTMHIVVGSQNPVKVDAVRAAVVSSFANVEVKAEGMSVPSGVRDQPMCPEETKQGAENRLKTVRERAPDADLWAAIEGGLETANDEMWAFAWVIIQNQFDKCAVRTASFPLPPAVVRLIQAGEELGHANDIVFGRKNSKHHEGAIGTLTGGLIDRRALYEHAAIMALIPTKNRDLWHP